MIMFLSRPFEYLVLLTIFCNCGALALSKPLPNNDTTPTNSVLVSNRIILKIIRNKIIEVENSP